MRTALRAHGARHGFTLHFSDTAISVRKKNRNMILSNAQYVQVPLMMSSYQFYFDTMQSAVSNGREVLDFSQPALQTYRRNGLSFHFPSVPEDDVMDVYTQWYTPQLGDFVWDAGAHAGATTCFLSQMVGPNGEGICFRAG